MSKQLIKFHTHKTGIRASVTCVCGNVVNLDGSNNAYFFEKVNEHPQQAACECGRPYTFRWTPDGVRFKWLPYDQPEDTDVVGSDSSDAGDAHRVDGAGADAGVQGTNSGVARGDAAVAEAQDSDAAGDVGAEPESSVVRDGESDQPKS